MSEITQLMENFLFHCKYEKNLSPLSIRAYSIDLNQFQEYLKNYYPIKHIQELDKNIIREYLKEIYRNNKPKTVKRKLATLKAFMNHLEYEDIIESNPFRKMQLKIKEGRQLPKIIELRNIRRLFSHLYTQKEVLYQINQNSYKIMVRDIAVLELLFATGMRVSELSNLKVDQLNTTKGFVLINGKGNKERIVPIPHKDILQILKEYFQLNKKEIIRGKYYFINRLNKRLSEQSIRLITRKHIKSINLQQHITPHMFRHSVATYLLENGADIRYIQNILGHSNISTTQIYAQVNEAPKRKILRLKHPRRYFNLS